MTNCNYIALNTDHLDPMSPYLDELFDLDIICTEEGIFINVDDQSPARHGRRA